MNFSKGLEMANASILHNRDAFATPLLLFAFDKLGMNVFEYEPETIKSWMQQIYPDVDKELPVRLNAAIGLFNSDLFWYDPTTFGIVCRTLNRESIIDGDAPDLFDVAWGVTEAGLLTSDPETGEPMDTFSYAIKKYVSYLINMNSIYDLPDALNGVGSPVPYPTEIDDAGMLESLRKRSESEAASIDYSVVFKMKMLLEQIRDLDIALSKDAAEELEKWLTVQSEN